MLWRASPWRTMWIRGGILWWFWGDWTVGAVVWRFVLGGRLGFQGGALMDAPSQG